MPVTGEKKGAERGKKLHGFWEEHLRGTRSLEKIKKGFEESPLDFDPGLLKGLKSALLNRAMLNLAPRSWRSRVWPSVVYLEQEFSVSNLWRGFMDVVHHNTQDDTFHIHDHKFMSSKYYIPSEEVLSDDPQTVIYCKAIIEFFGIDGVEMVYDYYGTKTIFWEPKKIFLTRDDIDEKWENIQREALSVVSNYGLTSLLDTSPNWLACGDYGGCEFKPLCAGV